ncbi:MAG: hypothetical protein GTO49_12030, partial [Anaerolineae bacterium]|nr:hypothetical protein [Anaerolineae bacterium]
MKIWTILVLSIITLLLVAPSPALAQGDPSAKCLSCHNAITPGTVKQWKDSKHSKVGVSCYVCHKAREADPS